MFTSKASFILHFFSLRQLNLCIFFYLGSLDLSSANEDDERNQNKRMHTNCIQNSTTVHPKKTKRQKLSNISIDSSTNSKTLNQLKESNNEGIRYSCDLCDYVVTTSRQLKHHRESKHKGIWYPCALCEYAATSSSCLKKHKKSKHLGIRYQCDL